MPRRMGKAERETRRARILEVIKKNPDITARALAGRFGISLTMIYAICKREGIRLESRDLPKVKDVEKFGVPRDPQWGYSGITREA